eukprot:13967422-Alexandrium_andersonii.AAC.1
MSRPHAASGCRTARFGRADVESPPSQHNPRSPLKLRAEHTMMLLQQAPNMQDTAETPAATVAL